jgi:hypothetical protein
METAQNNDVVVQSRPAGQVVNYSPQNLGELMKWAEQISKSDLCPKDFKNKSGDIVIAVQWGDELGLKPLQSLQNIAVINGRPSIWGDSLIGIVRASPVCEYIKETILADGTAECRAKRRGESEHVVTFSDADAKQAGLAGKQGPWTQYPKRMKQMRARSFALRDTFPDVLRGIPIAEEVMDYIERDITPYPITGTQAAQAALPPVDTDSEQRKALIAELAKVAREEGLLGYGDQWIKIGKEGRKLVGEDEHERLKAIAEASPATPKPAAVEHEPGADE